MADARAERPRIGIVVQPLVEGRVRGWSSRAFGIPATYLDAVRRAGGSPVLFAPPADAAEIVSLVDGVLLMGGGDVDPVRYGGDAGHPELYGVEPDRDELETDVVHAAEDARRPLLAVCRGVQVLNVAHGGTLHPHLADVEGSGIHGHPLSGDPILHDVKLAPDGAVAAATMSEVVAASSHHHQAIDRVGDGLIPIGWTDDGIVEAVELDGDGWVTGVQWHPEETAAEDPVQQALFDELVRRAAERTPSARRG
jgi:putative glutamine amidotransferase